MTAWYSVGDIEAVENPALDRLVDAWPEAPTLNLETLGMLTSVARKQVWNYAPESVDDDGNPVVVPDDVEDNLVYAQLKQATNLWNAGRTSSDGDVGMGEFVFTPRPLDKTIKGIIRPVGMPSVC